MNQIKIGPVLFSVAALSILSWLCSTLRESDYGKVGVEQLIGCTLRWDQSIEPMDFHTRPSRGLMDETPASAGSFTRPWFDVVGHMFSSSFESGWPRVLSENSGKAEYSPWKKFIRAMRSRTGPTWCKVATPQTHRKWSQQLNHLGIPAAGLIFNGCLQSQHIKPLPKNQSATCRVAGTTPDGEWLKFAAPINLKTYKFGHVFVSRHSL